MLLLEIVIESLGYLVGIKGTLQSAGDFDNTEGASLLLFKCKEKARQFLPQSFNISETWMPRVLMNLCGSARLTLHPLPHLCLARVIDKDQQVFHLASCKYRFNAATFSVCGECLTLRCAVNVQWHSKFLDHRL